MFNIPWVPMLYPTSNQNLQEFIDGTHKTIRNLDKRFHESDPSVVKLAKFIIENRNKMKFRLQQNQSIFYSDKKLASQLVETFWDYWSGSNTVNPDYDKLKPNTVGCRRLPHGKYQYQVYLRKDVHRLLNKSDRENLFEFMERNVDSCLITNRYVIDYLEGKNPHCYHGYFYVSQEKILTAIYIIAQKGIDKVIKFIEVKNAGNKKVKR